MKVIAGKDLDFEGTVWMAANTRVGYLEQEPQLDLNKTVGQNVLDGLKYKLELVKRYEEVVEEMSDPSCDMEALCIEQAELGERIDELECWEVICIYNLVVF
jgi:sulfate-transporting ATPase